MKLRTILSAPPGAPFADELLAAADEMERTLIGQCAGAGPYRAALEDLTRAGGKRLRPMLAWVCWHAAGGKMPIVPLMCMLETMHTASLIHDDFVDGALLRRGAATVNARFGGVAAMQSGDYLLARAMERLVTYRGTGINEALSAVAQEMCLGEIDQRADLFCPENVDIPRYFARIRRKTGLLMAESCRAGAVAGGADEETAEALRAYGEQLGLAFQLRDDLLDFDPAGDGKAPLADLRSGVISMPLLLLPDGARRLLKKREKTPGELAFLAGEARRSGALRKTAEALKQSCAAACSALDALPPCAEISALRTLAQTLSEVKNLCLN